MAERGILPFIPKLLVRRIEKFVFVIIGPKVRRQLAPVQWFRYAKDVVVRGDAAAQRDQIQEDEMNPLKRSEIAAATQNIFQRDFRRRHVASRWAND